MGTDPKITVKKDGSMRVSCSTTHARHDPAHCLATGLFRSVEKGKKNQNLDVTYTYGKNKSIQFSGAWALSASEMLVLQGVVAMAGPRGLLLDPEPETKIGKQLLLFLEPEFEALRMDSRVVCDTMSKLLREIGKTDSGTNIKNLKGSLKKLANVTVYIKEGPIEIGCHMLSYAFNDDDGALYIALNPRITQAIMGDRPHTRIDMAEVRGLKTNPARLLHQHLSAFINPGKTHKVSIETICSYIWPEPTTVAKTWSDRKTKGKKALKELEGVGWTVTEYKRWHFEITRPLPPSERQKN